MLLGACASSNLPTEHQAQRGQEIPQASSVNNTTASITVAEQTSEDENAGGLDALWKSRMLPMDKDRSSDFALGPGDLLQVSLPQIERIKDRTVRVSEENTIALPLLGVINTSGMTEDALRADLSRRMAKYFYHPQVGLFLLHAESRQVAVSGAVKSPGRYMLASRSDTIMMMISRAGGVTPDAAPRIILIPATDNIIRSSAVPGEAARAQGSLSDADSLPDVNSGDLEAEDASSVRVSRVSQIRPAEAAEADMSGSTRTAIDRVVISLSRASDQRYLNLPARTGDVIIVPAAGQVTVQGWVDKPGAFPITNGMTALGAIASAGGALFTSSATLLREQEDGMKSSIVLDLAKIKEGQQPDPEVHGGDVVVVERSVAGAVPYSLYFIVSKMGIGFPIPIP